MTHESTIEGSDGADLVVEAVGVYSPRTAERVRALFAEHAGGFDEAKVPREWRRVLRPTYFVASRPRLYALHVAGLIRRLQDGVDTRPATLAELLGAIVGTATRHELGPLGVAVLGYIAGRLRPDATLSKVSAPMFSEKAILAEIAKMRAKLYQSWRVVA